MLIEFKFKNYRSFRDESILSTEAVGLRSFKQCLIHYKSANFLPSIAIYGKNGGGKTNVIRAFWLAVQFIRNAQRTQHENALVPVHPFLLDDFSNLVPTSFEFTYVFDNIKYIYGFSATSTEIIKEYLFSAPHGQKALIFDRDHQTFSFRENAEKKKRQLISETVGPNQLYFSIACTMNESSCISAMRWFREAVFFSRDFTDIPQQLLENYENPNMLTAIASYAKAADVGIQDMHFDLKSTEVNNLNNHTDFPDGMPEELKKALAQFMNALSDPSNASESKLKMSEITATSYHKGLSQDGSEQLYPLQLSDESDGTRILMALAPGIEKVLSCGGVMLVDELEKGIHPLLVKMIISKFQSSTANPHHAQLIFTTHDTDLLNMDMLRKDQIYFVDKDSYGASVLYCISEFSTPTSENIRKGYLAGKYGATPDVDIKEVE